VVAESEVRADPDAAAAADDPAAVQSASGAADALGAGTTPAGIEPQGETTVTASHAKIDTVAESVAGATDTDPSADTTTEMDDDLLPGGPTPQPAVKPPKPRAARTPRA
jgi:hypothetical protein